APAEQPHRDADPRGARGDRHEVPREGSGAAARRRGRAGLAAGGRSGGPAVELRARREMVARPPARAVRRAAGGGRAAGARGGDGDAEESGPEAGVRRHGAVWKRTGCAGGAIGRFPWSAIVSATVTAQSASAARATGGRSTRVG